MKFKVVLRLIVYDVVIKKEGRLMRVQKIFKRYEIKYLITKQQKNLLLDLMKEHMVQDEYGKTSICNIYFDTPQYLLIRRSLDKPIYKEKLRLRSYGIATEESDVFIEIKKKYDAIVYKRRVSVKEKDAMNYLCKRIPLDQQNQIIHEIDYFYQFYENLKPVVYLSYQREAFYGKNDHDLRITFDENIVWRDYDFSLCSHIYGKPILNENNVLLEIKIIGAIPLWLTQFLSENHIYKTSFSKYGKVYQILNGGKNYA